MIANSEDGRTRARRMGRLATAVGLVATAGIILSATAAPVRLVGVTREGDTVLIESTEPVAYSVSRPDALSLVVDGPSGIRDGLAAFGWEAALSTLYTAGFSTIVAYGIFNGLLSRNPAPAVVPWVLLVPPIGVVSAWLALDETPSTAEVLGGALLVVGALVANGVVRRRRRPQADVPREPAPEERGALTR